MGSKTGGNAPSGEPAYIVPTYKSPFDQKSQIWKHLQLPQKTSNFYNIIV